MPGCVPFLMALLCSCGHSITRTAGPFHYQLSTDWPNLPREFKLGNPSGIAIDKDQHILVFHRAGRSWPIIMSMPEPTIPAPTLLMLDSRSGKMLKSWGKDLFIMPHGLAVDADNNIWVTDVGLHQVFKFSQDGQLLLKLGEAKIAGNDSLHFNRPTDVAIAPDGSFYVSDGYGNSRVIKFSPDGKYLFEWGRKGNQPGEFDIPHSLTLDEKGNVYVADRENCRIQVFDPTGKLIKIYSDKNFGNICSVRYDTVTHCLFAVDEMTTLKLFHHGSDIIILDSTGKVLLQFGRSGGYDGPKCWYHDIAIARDGSIYIGDILGNRVQQFKRVK